MFPPLSAFQWASPDLIAESLIPALIPPPILAAPQDRHLVLLSTLADPDRWCPPDDEPQLVEALLAALRQMPGFPRGMALHLTQRPTDLLPETLRGRAGFVITGGIAHPTHAFTTWRLAGGLMSQCNPDHALPNGLFDALAQMLAPSLPELLASESTCEAPSVRLRAALVKQLGTMPTTCDQLLGIELPRLGGLLPINARWPPRGSCLLDETLLKRIQEAAPVLRGIFRDKRTIERALGLPLRSLKRRLDREVDPTERKQGYRQHAGLPTPPGAQPAVQDIAGRQGSIIGDTSAAGDRADAQHPPEVLAAPDRMDRPVDPCPTAHRLRR